ncbi:MAG: hypothetical protein HOP28_15750 [Gemmatimonadales bacterium]|nr:hypothetical protein [Gemmatimonadales bacterium]
MALKLEERDDLAPVCPHCAEPLEKLFFRQIRELMAGKRLAYFCPHCHRLLGLTHY